MDIIGYNYQQERSFDTLEGTVKIIGLGNGIRENQAGNPEKGTKECPKCHTRLPRTQRFCGKCGFDTGKKPKVQTEDSHFCPSCGYRIPMKMKFCPACGSKTVYWQNDNAPTRGELEFYPKEGTKPGDINPSGTII